MKPRIRKKGFCPYGMRVWTCIGDGAFGQGDSPRLAFDAWQRFARFYGAPSPARQEPHASQETTPPDEQAGSDQITKRAESASNRKD